MKGLVFLLLAATGLVAVEAGQCCNSYYNLFGNYVDAQWCENYCCGSTILKLGLYCCDSSALQAADYDTDFCYLWWSHHVWVPIVSSLVFIGLVVTCCICCCRCCCGGHRKTVIINPGGYPGPAMVNVQQSMTNVGYDQPGSYSKY